VSGETGSKGGAAPPFPRANPDLAGHGWAEQRFLAAWRSGRLPHAWLIYGPPGIGKATFAFRAARFALSGGGAGGGGGLFADGPVESLAVATDHPVFRRVASGGHGDLMTLERGFVKEKNGKDDDGDTDPRDRKRRTVIRVDEVRAAGHFLRMTPAEGGWRVVVVDCADDLNPNAANALLKMLEEPPDRALLLLVSHAPGRLLPTIRSRCCRLALKPLSEDLVLGLIGRYRPDLAHADAVALARLGEGSIGRALALAEEGGLDLYREMVALMARLPAPAPGVHALGDRLGRQGAEAEAAFRTAIGLLAWWVSRLVREGARGRESAPVVPEEEGLGARLLAAGGVDRWMEVWEKITRLTDQTDGLNLDRKQVVLNVFHALGEAARA
jgi:DNA polymerase-3 subunit delta'